jgi:hypothetical protein
MFWVDLLCIANNHKNIISIRPNIVKGKCGGCDVTAAPDFGQRPTSKEMASKILRRVPYKEGFHFSTGIGEHTDKTSTSLSDFMVDLQSIDLRSVEFHFLRQDFEKWIRIVLGDEELAMTIGALKKDLRGEELRKAILIILKKRLDDLTRLAMA